MFKGRAWRHLVDVFRWSTAEKAETAEVLAAMLGMAGPILLGAMTGHLAAGFAAALGALAVSRVEVGASLAAHVRREALALAPVFLAALLAAGFGGRGLLSELLLTLTAVAAAIIGSFSRPMAVATTRFVLFLMIVKAMPALPYGQTATFLALIALGAVWTSVLSLAFVACMRRKQVEAPAKTQQGQATWKQKFKRWAQSLRTFDGWNYTIRLGACLSLAAVVARLWPHHHFGWIGVTVALLISRASESAAVKTTQRTLGTAIGVVLSALVLPFGMPVWTLVVAIGFLAGARYLLRARNYLAYSIVMTPLVLLIIDAGQPPELSLLVDRLVATVIGGALVAASDGLAQTRRAQ